jgi:hypothetical protein
MIRRAILFRLLLVLAGATSRAGAADEPARDKPEPPALLKKKDKPPADEARPDKKPEAPAKPGKKSEPPRKDGAKDDDPPPQDPEQDPKEILARITKNMKASEDRLAKKDPSEATREIQRDIVKDLDSLIKQSQQSSNSSSSSSSQSKNQRNQQGRGMKMVSQRQRASGQRPGQAAEQQSSTAGKRPGGGGMSRGGGSKIDDLYKDIWGHLPETLRQEMDAYAKEKFMLKYSDLIKQYYATLAEKNRRKGDEPR